MKKILLSIIALTMSASMAFGYFAYDNFFDILSHKNQFRARLDRFGVLGGTENIRIGGGITGGGKQTIFENVGLAANGTKGFGNFIPNVFIGAAYKSEMVGVGVGYQYGQETGVWQHHTPVLALGFLNNTIRLNVPVTIGFGTGAFKDISALSTAIQARYYPPVDFLTQIRLYINYGENTKKSGDTKLKQSSFAAQLRLYFKVLTDPVKVEPILKVYYATALKTTLKGGGVNLSEDGNALNITALSKSPKPSENLFPEYYGGMAPAGGYDISSPYIFGVQIPLGLSAGSDIVSLYLEPSLGFAMMGGKSISTLISQVDANGVTVFVKRKDPFMALGYGVYAEIYFTPVKNLEFYIEAEAGSTVSVNSLGNWKTQSGNIGFNGATGITWYF